MRNILDMRPSAPFDDAGNSASMNIKFHRQVGIAAFPRDMHESNSFHFVLGKFRRVALFPFVSGKSVSNRSSFLRHITHVGKVSSKKKMLWVAALRVIARVANFDFRSIYWTISKYPCNTACGAVGFAPIQGKKRIPISRLAFPKPTLVFCPNKDQIPKSNFWLLEVSKPPFFSHFSTVFFCLARVFHGRVIPDTVQCAI